MNLKHMYTISEIKDAITSTSLKIYEATKQKNQQEAMQQFEILGYWVERYYEHVPKL